MFGVTKFIDRRLALFHEKEFFVKKVSHDFNRHTLFPLLRDINRLKRTVQQELQVNERLIRRITNEPFFERYAFAKIKNKSLRQEIGTIKQILHTLAANLTTTHQQICFQQSLLKKISLLKLRPNFSIPAEYKKHFQEFKKAYQQEKVAKKRITAFSQKGYAALKKRLGELEREKQVFQTHRQLIKDITKAYIRFFKAVGDEAQLRFYYHEIEALLLKAKDIRLYAYMKKDFDALKLKIDYVMKHPKESKLAYAAVTAYIVLPTTFELTFVILFLRYSTKLLFDFSQRKKAS